MIIMIIMIIIIFINNNNNNFIDRKFLFTSTPIPKKTVNLFTTFSSGKIEQA